MPHDKLEEDRLALIRAGKLEDRRSSSRPPLVQEIKKEPAQENTDLAKMRPELIAIGVLVLVMIVLAIVGM